MQNQSTSNQTSLQQGGTSLQQNNGGVQQVGSPEVSPDVSRTLSQEASNKELTVQSAQTDPNLRPQISAASTDPAGIIIILAFIFAVIAGVTIWIKNRKLIEAMDAVTEAKSEVVAAPKKTTPKKSVKKSGKSTRKQRQAKR